jgi:dTDP-4-amino-4,6-dideoxygalactose transaminase
MNRIPLIKPYITQEVKDKVCDVLESGYLTEGEVTREFEQNFKSYIGSNFALAVTSCTTGLEVALRALGVGPGDEVIVPDYTYPATASAVAIVGATIVILDVNSTTMVIDYDQLDAAITEKTKAIIPVSIFGNPPDYERLLEIKDKYEIFIIEDAACALGAKYKEKMIGNLADISVFSLHPRKFITTGEGGMVTTSDPQWAKWMESYKHFGMSASESRFETQFVRIGTNYKLSNIQAAVGLVQMKHIDSLLSQRSRLAKQYCDLLADIPAIKIPDVTPGGEHSWQSFCVFIENRNHVIATLKEKNIETQIGTYALHMQKAFKDCSGCIIKGDMAGSRYAFDHCLTLPLYHDMTEAEQRYVVSELLKCLA